MIKCARQLFPTIGGSDVTYDIVDSFKNLYKNK